MRNLKINHLAVVAAIPVHMIIPAVWYGVFQTQWLAQNKLTLADAEGASPTIYLIAILTGAITVYGMAFLFKQLNIDSVVKGLQTSALFWFVFLFAQVLTQDMFAFRPLLAFIDQGNTFLTFLATGAILGGWRKYE